MRPDPPPTLIGAPARSRRIVGMVAAALVCTALPLFLVGALSPWIGEDLGLDPAQVGIVVGTFFLVSAVLAVPGGAVVDRIGAAAALRIGTLTSAAAAAAIGGLADRMAWLLTLMVLAACAVPLVDTGNARAIAAAVPRDRHGLAYGVKEASIPAAALLAGLAIPAVAVQAGWRPAFFAAALLAALVGLLLVPRGLDRPERPQRHAATRTHGRTDSRTSAALRLLVVATAAAGAAATAAPAFLVPAVVAHGTSEAAAGLLLAAGSAAGIATRVVVGILVDRTRLRDLRLAAALMAAGAVGLLALGTGPAWTTGPGVMLALGAGWGWTGLTFFGAVRLSPARPAAAAGRVLAGLMAGGATGTAAFGWLASGPGYLRAWQAAAAAMAAAALLTRLAARRG